MFRDLISLTDLTARDVAAITDRAVELGGAPPDRTRAGLAVGICFAGPSTRTRTSFWRAATSLGADVINYDAAGLQLSTGETWEDTSRVLAQYLDVLVVRTNGDIRDLRRLAGCSELSVVNALTRHEHPTQALADLATLKEVFGDLDGRHLVYTGEGNGTAVALAQAAALTPGMSLTVVTPEGYGMPGDAMESVRQLADAKERVREVHAFTEVREKADAVYTSRWQQMGVAKPDADWLTSFEPYRVDDALVDRIGDADTVVLHDLPAVRGQEITTEVLDGGRSRVIRQARHKLTAATAVLEWCTAR